MPDTHLAIGASSPSTGASSLVSVHSTGERAKRSPSALGECDGDKLLREKGINTLFFVGMSKVGCVLATYQGAEHLDYRAFMVKRALISHDATLTKSVYDICSTIGSGPLKLLLETARAQ